MVSLRQNEIPRGNSTEWTGNTRRVSIQNVFLGVIFEKCVRAEALRESACLRECVKRTELLGCLGQSSIKWSRRDLRTMGSLFHFVNIPDSIQRVSQKYSMNICFVIEEDRKNFKSLWIWSSK